MPLPIGGSGRIPGPILPPVAGFVPPRCDLVVPDNLGRPPTLADVTVKAGFDGRSPADAAAQVLQHSKAPISAQNQAFATQSATDVHKAFTIAVNNAFVPGSPFAALAARFPKARFAILGTLSEVHPSMVEVRPVGKPPMLFQPGPGGAYQPVASKPYQVVMRADLRLAPAGVRVSYPAWSVPALSGSLGKVTEG